MSSISPRRMRRVLIAGTAALSAALLLSSCAGGAGSDTESASGVDAATATSLADFGTMEELEAAAIAEGQLNVIALPRDWAN